ncbi:MAG: hypothetical protein ACKPKO_13085, partial [Candidatus Fonsibacter sp.]
LINTKMANPHTRTTPTLNSILDPLPNQVNHDSEPNGSRHPPCVSSTQPDTNSIHTTSKE